MRNSAPGALGSRPDERPARLRLPFAEFVALSALLMALTAMSIDIMLPALPQIGSAFALAEANDRQLVVTSYLIGFAAGQLVVGPLSDRFGRRRLLLAGLALFVCGTLAAVLAGSFRSLLLARAVQGLGAAAPRVVSIAVIRDLFSGRQMARVMSLVMMVFIVVPVFAPAVGQALLQVGEWRWMFYLLLAVGLASMVWAGLRLPETHAAAGAGGRLGGALVRALLGGETLGYALAAGFIFGSLMAYIGTAQQVFVDVYGLGPAFPIAFGAVAGVMALASFTNARLVQRLGMRRLSHAALVGFCAASLALLALSLAGLLPLVAFCLLLAAAFFMFGLIMPNFNAIAMQPLASAAGTASSLLGFYTTGAGAAFGWAIGRLFDGTVRPLAAGFALLGLAALATVAVTEGRRGLFRGE